MYRSRLIVFISIVAMFNSCTGPQIAMKSEDGTYILYQKAMECEEFKDDGFSYIVEENYKATEEAIPVIEMQYTCTANPLSLSQGMYDRFGPWNEHVYHPLHDVPVLLWHNVSLISFDTNKYTVAIYALESKERIFSAASIFDEKGSDVFSNDGLKNTFVEYFASVIHRPKVKNKEFLDLYTKSF